MTVEVLDRIKNGIGISTEDFLSLLEMTEQGYLEVVSGRKSLPGKSVDRLADYLEVTPEAILTGKLSYLALASKFRGCPTVLPERYSEFAFARMRTAAHLLWGIEHLGGYRLRSQVLKSLQVSESVFFLPNLPVSIKLSKDLCDFIQKTWGNTQLLTSMGKYSAVQYYHSQLGKIYRTLEGPKQIYEATINQLVGTYFDSYYKYQLLKLTQTETVIKVRQNEDTMDILKSKYFGSLGTCAQKLGVIASFTSYQGLPPAHAVEKRCIYRGDPYCAFHIDFENATLRKKNAPNLVF